MRPFMIAALSAGLLATTSALAAPDAAQARSWAASCSNCHGTNGAARPGMPGLAGESKTEIIDAMADFKSDARKATVMNQIAKGYSDEQIAAIAEWFSVQKK